MKNKLTVMDVKQAIWDKRFRELFPEYKESLDRVIKDPGCACNMNFIRSLLKHKDRLKQYFPTKEIILPEDEPLTPNQWLVISCPIDQLEDKIRSIPPGKRVVAAAQWKDRITVVINDVSAFIQIPTKPLEEQLEEVKTVQPKYKVINTTTKDLIHELRKLPEGKKTLCLSRWQDKITVIVNDLTTLF